MECECVSAENKSEKSGNFSASMKGIILGSLIGAAVALLASPRSGIENRNLLREKSQELKNRALDTAQQTSERVSEQANQLVNRGQDILNTQKSTIQSSVGSTVEGLKEGIRTYKEQGSQPYSEGIVEETIIIPIEDTSSNKEIGFVNPDITDTGGVM